ncbi:hypothetical protein [Acidiferrobacter sp.]|jgi:hypothetical protein|uniref:hypothetical protein n=1 Tax=Acidiferrobacter sp. TaxID=1872107 RepID=UPI00262D2EFF|nr:hypothetical protein [Acidiferrobacter sp.]
MTPIQAAAIRAYSSRWTAALIAFELIGAILVGRHSRTTSLWPLLAWLACVPMVRYLYLQKLHDAAPIAWRHVVRRTYGVTAWLMLAGAMIVLLFVALGFMISRLPEILAFWSRHGGYAGVVAGMCLLAAGLVTAGGAAFLWGGLSIIAYARAVVEPARRIREVVVQGLACAWQRAPVVVGMSTFQGLLVVYAVGAQLAKPSGMVFMPVVWPAVFFAPVALAFLLALAESGVRWRTQRTSRAVL